MEAEAAVEMWDGHRPKVFHSPILQHTEHSVKTQILGVNVVKTDKCMGASRFGGGRVPGLPQSLCLCMHSPKWCFEPFKSISLNVKCCLVLKTANHAQRSSQTIVINLPLEIIITNHFNHSRS